MSKIAINFYRLNLSSEETNINYINFINNEHLKEIRENNKNTIFIRSREKIYYWGEAPSINSKITTEVIKKSEKSNILVKVLSSAFLKQFYEYRNKFQTNNKVHIHKVIELNDEVLKNEFEALKLYKVYHVHFTPLYVTDHLELGFTVSTSIKVKILWTRQDFINANVEHADLKFNEETDNVLVNTQSVYRIAKYFEYTSKLKNTLDLLNAIQNEKNDVDGFVSKYFKANLNKLIYPKNLKVNSIDSVEFEANNNSGNFANVLLDKPELYYYKGKYPTNLSTFGNRRKIEFNKPFSYDDFENRQIKIKFILPEIYYATVLSFFTDIKTELNKTFNISKDNITADGRKIEDFSLKSYQKVLNSIKDVDLVIVIIDESHELLPPNESPYYFCKSEFIKRGINTQEIQIQQIIKFLNDKKKKNVNYTDHNLALNIYAKLGGIAWTIKPNQLENELVIGIGATTNDEGQPILGLTSVFRGDGKYLFGKVTSVTSMEDYEETLVNILSTTIDDSIEQGLIDTEKDFRLIFHIFKPAGKNNEIKALDKLIKRYSDYSFKYTFVHIGYGHNYRFYTYNYINEQIVYEQKKGFGVNKIGTFIKVNNRLGFLCLKQISSSFIKIDIHKESTFLNLEYIAKQVYEFVEMSHTSYNKSSRPVTIKYPNLMAFFAEKFNQINGFYPREISMPDDSLWFI